ncbi:MAG: HAD family hydrolase [Gemmatimonadetes bacterium]|nr:HAD family hydrolase [Gemmatimonadota bacterium]
MTAPPYDLVIFDIDGTLLATDLFWLDIGRSATRKVFLRHGIQQEPPEGDRFLEAMGLPMGEFWRHVLGPELGTLAPEMEREAQELEEVAFARGVGAMYGGARRLLDDLHAAGVTLALASNCGKRYLEGFVSSFGLNDIVTWAYCAESPGIRSKADMLKEIVAAARPERPVMIGDRNGDREAARANRVPFILFTGGFGASPAVDGDGTAASYAELRGQLLG